MTLKDKLHKLEHGLLDSKDEHAEENKQAEREREMAAEAKLQQLQNNPSSGIDKTHLSTVPAAESGEPHIDSYNLHHVEPRLHMHHRAQNTGLRPDSQEKADGEGTAGDDLAI